MPFLSKLRRAVTRPSIVFCGLVFTLGFSGWKVWDYFRSAPVRGRIDSGVRWLKQGDTTRAEAELLAAVRLDPNSAQAWELLGDLYLSNQQYKPAMSAFAHVFALAPNTTNLQGRMATVALLLGDTAPARLFAEGQLNQDANNIAALQVLVTLEQDAGQSQQAIKHMRQLIALQPHDILPLNALADELEARDSYDQLIPVAKQLIALAPDDANGYVRLGIALYIANQDASAPNEAKAALQKALQLDPKNVDAHRYLGRTYLRLNQPREAITQFEAVGRGRPYATAQLMELSLAYRMIGDVKRADAARARFSKLKDLNTQWVNLRDQIKRSPSDPAPYVQLGQSLLTSNFGLDNDSYQLYRYHYAKEELHSVAFYLDKAYNLKPTDTNVIKANRDLETIYTRYLRKATLELKQTNYSQANADAERTILLRPNDARTLKLTYRILGTGFNPYPTPPAEVARR